MAASPQPADVEPRPAVAAPRARPLCQVCTRPGLIATEADLDPPLSAPGAWWLDPPALWPLPLLAVLVAGLTPL